MIRRKGQATIVAMILFILFLSSLVATIYIINTAINRYVDTSRSAFKKISEKGIESLTILDAYPDESDFTLVIKVRNSGDTPLRILSIWINNTIVQLDDSNIYLIPNEVATIDTNVTIRPTDKYIINIISDRGKIYYFRYPPPVPGEWECIGYSPIIFPPGSTATYAYTIGRASDIYYPSGYNVVVGTYLSGDLTSLYYDDNDYLSISASPIGYNVSTYLPSDYSVLIGSESGGDLSSLYYDDGDYLIIEPSPVLDKDTLYLHAETYVINTYTYYMFKTLESDGPKTILTYITTDSKWHVLASYIYPLNGLTLSSGTWTIYYRLMINVSYLDGWRHRIPIYITENTGRDLTYYQVRIVLNSSNFDYNEANPDGSDIRFTDSDGVTLLPYWIERWDPDGNSIIWVKVPLLPGGETKIIYLYYGNPYASSLSNLLAVMTPLPASDGTNYRIYYQEWIMPDSYFQSIGSPKGWHADDRQWRYRLPFNFPYYDRRYRYIAIASNGYIHVNGWSGWSDWTSTLREFKYRKYISPYWADLMTCFGNNRDIYIKTDYSDSYGSGIYIRWRTCYYRYSGVQNFAAVLYQNGLIRFDYGYFSGRSRTDDTPVIGVSKGDRIHYTVSSYNNHRNPSNYNSIMFWPRKKANKPPTITYGTESEQHLGSIAINIHIIDSGGNIVNTVGERVAKVDLYGYDNGTWRTYVETYTFPGYTSSYGEYLRIDYIVRSTTSISTTYALNVDDNDLSTSDQSRIKLSSTDLPSRYKYRVVVEGFSNLANIWCNITYGIDYHYTINGVNTTIQLYNYNLGRYAVVGEDGYISEIYVSAPNNIYTGSVVYTEPTQYRDSSDSSWRMSIYGYRDTVFNEIFKAYLDLTLFKVAYAHKYSAVVDITFSGMSTENLDFIEYLSSLKSNVTGVYLEIKIYNYTSGEWMLLTTSTLSTSETRYKIDIRSGLEDVISGGESRVRINTTLTFENAPRYALYIDYSNMRCYYVAAVTNKIIYVGRGDSSEFYSYIISTGEWIRLSDTPFIWDGMSRMTYVDSMNMIYAISGNKLYKYNITEDKWSVEANLPPAANVGEGASISYSPLYPYTLVYIPGGGDTKVYIYDLVNREWTRVSDIPEAVSSYSLAIGSDDGYIYVIVGRTTGGFYRYDIGNDSWESLGIAPTSELSGMAYYNGYLYISDLNGGLYRYTVSNNTWNSLKPNIPVRSDGEGNRLLTDGIFLYYLRFDYSAEMIRIRISRLVAY